MFSGRGEIVIADDNAVLLGVLAEIFRECGWHVRTARDGFEALQAIQEQAPDFLLSDLQMDGMSGFELLSVVRRRFPSVRVIAMSGSISGSIVPVGLAADAFYAKGDSSVATLLQQVAELPSVEELTAVRYGSDVWVPALPVTSFSHPTLAVPCPHCLRVAYFTPEINELATAKVVCKWCGLEMQAALAREWTNVDLAMWQTHRTSGPSSPGTSALHPASTFFASQGA